jgi:hypothetical protein
LLSCTCAGIKIKHPLLKDCIRYLDKKYYAVNLKYAV